MDMESNAFNTAEVISQRNAIEAHLQLSKHQNFAENYLDYVRNSIASDNTGPTIPRPPKTFGVVAENLIDISSLSLPEVVMHLWNKIAKRNKMETKDVPDVIFCQLIYLQLSKFKRYNDQWKTFFGRISHAHGIQLNIGISPTGYIDVTDYNTLYGDNLAQKIIKKLLNKQLKKNLQHNNYNF